MKELDKAALLKMMKDMLLIRNFEEKVNEMFQRGVIHGTTHLGVGQEGSAVGSISALEPEDYIISNHRGHGHCLAKGATVNGMMAELFGKEAGYCKGKGGSMHIVDVATRNLGANGIVGGGFSISVGAALALKKKGLPHILANFFGDGSTNEGSFHESLNLASLWKLPMLFICENNLYGMSTPIGEAMAVKNVAERASAYNMPSQIVDGNDVLAVYEAVRKAAARVRNGEGPELIELKTYRWTGHSKSDPRVYRTREEEKEWKEKCPIKRFKEVLIGQKVLTEEEFVAIEQQAVTEIEEAVAYSNTCPYPTLDNIENEVYA